MVAAVLFVTGCGQSALDKPVGGASLPVVQRPELAPHVASPSTVAFVSPTEARTIGLEEAVHLLPKLGFEEAHVENPGLRLAQGLSFELEYPKHGPGASDTEFCIRTMYDGIEHGAVCADVTTVGGIVSFGFGGDDVNPPMAMLVTSSEVVVKAPADVCESTSSTSFGTVELHACVVFNSSITDAFSINYELAMPSGSTMIVEVPYAQPPQRTTPSD